MLPYSQACIDLVKYSEGCRLEAYQDPSVRKIWTIGYGHTKNVEPGTKITIEQALRFLTEDLDIVHRAVDAWVDVELTQGQVDALTGFAFNVGLGRFLQSTLLRLLNQGRYPEAAAEFPKWTGHVELPGLVTRRAAEQALFLS